MLPYRLRPPVYGNKWKKTKGTQGNVEPEYSPLKEAIQQDLRHIWSLCEQQQQELTQQNDDATTTDNHVEEGHIFSQFRSSAMEDAKLSLLLTLLYCPRSDRAKWTQLLYDACLEFDNDNPPFCLYAAAESSSVAQGGTLETTTLAQKRNLLPMDVQDNSRFKFRRSFDQPIRMSRCHFTQLLQWQEQALAGHADCELQQWHAREERLHKRQRIILEGDTADTTNTEENQNNNQQEWTCRCGGLCDSLAILPRIFDRVDLSSYPGPLSLEALAARIHHQQQKKQPPQQHTNNGTQQDKTVDPLLHNNNTDETATNTFAARHATTLLSQIQKYKSYPIFVETRANIQHNNLSWWRDKLAPSLQASESSLQRLASLCRSGEATVHVPQKPIDKEHNSQNSNKKNNNTKQSGTNDSTSNATATRANDAADTETEQTGQGVSYDVVLPEHIPMALRNGIQQALNSMLQRNPPKPATTGDTQEESVVPGTGGAALARSATTQHNTQVSFVGESTDVDEASEYPVAMDDDSVTQSSLPGIGGAALGALLAQATRKSTAVADDESIAQSSHADSLFLRRSKERTNNATPERSGALDDDSIAQSTGPGHGGAALGALLAQATRKTTTEKRATDDDSIAHAGSFARRSRERAQMEGPVAFDDDSIAQSSRPGHGGAALGALLAQANSPAALDDVSTAQNSSLGHNVPTVRARRAAAKAAPSRPAALDDDDSTVQSTRPGHGGAALGALLAQAVGNDASALTTDNGTRAQGSNLGHEVFTSGQRDAMAAKAAPTRRDDLDESSIAESSLPGLGGAALGALLSQATQKTSSVAARGNKQAKTMTASPLAAEEDSMAQSSDPGHGGAALGALLSQAASRAASRAPTGNDSRVRRSRHGRQHGTQVLPTPARQPTGDDDSIAQSSLPGHGGAALGDLLSRALGKASTTAKISVGVGRCSHPRQGTTTMRNNKGTEQANMDDDSIAQSSYGGHGGAALGALLSQAKRPPMMANGDESLALNSNAGIGGIALGGLMEEASRPNGSTIGANSSSQRRTRATCRPMDFLVMDDDGVAEADTHLDERLLESDENQSAMQMAETAARDQQLTRFRHTGRKQGRNPRSQDTTKVLTRRGKKRRSEEENYPSGGQDDDSQSRKGRARTNKQARRSRLGTTTSEERQSVGDGEQSLASTAEYQGMTAIEMLLSKVEKKE